MKYSRKDFMGVAVVAAIALFSSTGYGQVSLTLGHGAAPGNPRSVGAEKFAELVAQKTNGAVKIRIAGSEQLGNDVAMLTSLRTGTLDFSINSQGAASGLVPEVAALGLPFLFSDSGAALKVLNGPVGQELASKFDAVGMIPLDWWDNGIRHITNSKRPINEPEDLKGLKIRTPADPMTIDIFKSFGAATEQIAFSELYVALQQKVVDGQENPLANIASSKLYEVNPFISMSAHKWESTPFLMSKIGAGRLNKDQMAAVKAAAVEAGDLQRKLMRDSDTKLLAEFKANSAVKVNEADRAALRQASVGVYDTWKAKPFGAFVGRLVDAAK